MTVCMYRDIHTTTLYYAPRVFLSFQLTQYYRNRKLLKTELKRTSV